MQGTCAPCLLLLLLQVTIPLDIVIVAFLARAPEVNLEPLVHVLLLASQLTFLQLCHRRVITHLHAHTHTRTSRQCTHTRHIVAHGALRWRYLFGGVEVLCQVQAFVHLVYWQWRVCFSLVVVVVVEGGVSFACACCEWVVLYLCRCFSCQGPVQARDSVGLCVCV